MSGAALVSDEAKRASNIQKHGFDVGDADLIFEGDVVVTPARSVGDEVRQMAVGTMLGGHVTLIFTERGDGVIRCISLRRARPDERRKYQALHG